MRNRNVSALLIVGVVAAFLLAAAMPAEAELICKKFRPSGPKVCYQASTGSVDCLAIAQGVAATLAKDCDALTGEGECYIVVKCSIFGTINPDDVKRKDPDPDYSYCGQITNGQFPGGTDCFWGIEPNCNEACYIRGEGKCLNPKLHYEENGTAFIGGPLTSNSATATCDSGGICTSEASVDTSGVGGCPNRHWTPLEFTPFEFYGELSFCPGGYINTGGSCTDCEGNSQDELECCATDKRNPDGSCFKPFQVGQPTEGQPGFIRTLCTFPLEWCAENEELCYDDDGNILDNVPYDCNEI
jgi:hypothetical protein